MFNFGYFFCSQFSSSLLTIPLVLFSALIPFKAHGQNKEFSDGYILTLENDTIRGQIKVQSINNYQEGCTFISNGTSRDYYPGDLLGFSIDNQAFFRSGVVDSAYVQAFIEGPMNVYKLDSDFIISNDKGDKELLVTETVKVHTGGDHVLKQDNRWKGLVTYFVSDCNEDQPNLKDARLNAKTLTRIASRYNKCRQGSFKEYGNEIPWARAEVGFGLTGNINKINISDRGFAYVHLADSYSDFSLQPSFILNIYSPRMTEKWKFQMEVLYTRTNIVNANHSRSVSNFSEPIYFNYSNSIKFSTVSVPVSVKFTTRERSVSYFIQGGLGLDFHLNYEASSYSEVVMGDVTTPGAREPLDILDKTVSYHLGAGVGKTFGETRTELQFRYAFTLLSSNTKDYTATMSRFGLGLNVYFWR